MLCMGPYLAWIVVDDSPAETYNKSTAHSSDTATASGWISSKAGKKFSVLWRNLSREIAVEAVISIDGVECNRHIMLNRHDFPDRPDTLRVAHTRISDSACRDFIFADIQATRYKPFPPAADYNSSEPGVIQLDLWGVQTKRIVRRPLLLDYNTPLLQPHERAKNGRKHSVTFGDEYSVPLPTVDMVDGARLDTAPFVSFIFRYKPRDLPEPRVIDSPLGTIQSVFERDVDRRPVGRGDAARGRNESEPLARSSPGQAGIAISEQVVAPKQKKDFWSTIL
ncbi:hypothetical protein D9757_005143 [Collybiopsis confluens]|uniref:DUF7918 domain-containing protein n=1 Tax=Collybiopsis confluens TaxID=2823264 RepID=A0A8H5MCN3_9AGAR|nr:hypothetical protein D9757_005143 [Collybiopsis confluens]